MLWINEMNQYSISFVARANLIHNNKYDYSLNKNGFKAADKIQILCPEHGLFEQRACNHTRETGPCGCPKCAAATKADNTRLDTNEFIKNAKEKHGDKYDYSITVYTGRKKNIKYICPEHGTVEQTANNHLKYGCGLCSRPELDFLYSDNPTELFIQKAKKIHGERYDYSKSQYDTTKKQLTIICPIHGEFKQTPSDHLQGASCRRCNDSLGENKISKWLTENGITFEREKRIAAFNPRKPFDFYLLELDIYLEYDGEQHFLQIPKFGQTPLHKQQERDRKRNEWCRANNVKLEIITYQEDISKRLSEITGK